jgi:hypothetical protein
MTLRSWELGVAVTLLLVLLCLAALVTMDLYGLATRTSEYQRVYGFTGAEHAWSHRSAGNYIVGSLLLLAFLLAGMGLAVWRLRSCHRASARALHLYILVAVVLVAFSFMQWWSTGFDH